MYINIIKYLFTLWNKTLGLSTDCRILCVEENHIPIEINTTENTLTICEKMIDVMKTKELIYALLYVYSVIHITKLGDYTLVDGKKQLNYDPEIKVSELCKQLNIGFIRRKEMNDILIRIRKEVYPFPHKYYSNYFLGDVFRNGISRLKITKIEEQNGTLVYSLISYNKGYDCIVKKAEKELDELYTLVEHNN